MLRRRADCNGGTFVALVSGEAYTSAALCLRHQLTRVGTVCPVHLVVDDRAERQLSDNAGLQLQRAYGRRRILSLVSLIEAARQQLQPQGAAGRRLLAGRFSQHHAATVDAMSAKMWLWALPADRFKLVVFLDLDIVVTRSVDELLLRGLASNVSMRAVPCGADKRAGSAMFNSGVFAFRPSLSALSNLTRLARYVRLPWRGYLPFGWRTHSEQDGRYWPNKCAPVGDEERSTRLFPTFSSKFSNSFSACRASHHGALGNRIPLACEKHHTDQSIMNYAFRKSWQPLESIYNVHWVRSNLRFPAGCAATSASACDPCSADVAEGGSESACVVPPLVHFAGELKPWEPVARRSASIAGPLGSHWRERWRRACPFWPVRNWSACHQPATNRTSSNRTSTHWTLSWRIGRDGHC